MKIPGLTIFGDGRWLIQLTRQGIKKTKRGSGGEKAGRDALAKIEAELAQACKLKDAASTLGLKVDSRGEVERPLTFSQLFNDKYLAWARTELHPVTLRTRDSVHWHLLSFFGEVALPDIDSRLVDAFKDKRMKEGVIYKSEKTAQQRAWRPLSKAGLAEQLKVLRSILSWAVRKGYLKSLPHIEMPREKRGEPGAAKPVRFLTREERGRLLRRSKPALADVIRFGLMTGARPGEIFHLRCRSVDLKRRTITIEEQPCPMCPDNRWLPKVGTWRQIEIAPELLVILKRILKGRRPDDLIFESVHGQPFTRLHGGGGSFNRALVAAGLDRQGLSFYSLRHTFASDLATAGVPLQKIGKLMGHTDLRSTQRYAHLMPSALDGAVDHLTLPDEWADIGAPATTHVPHLSLVPEEVSAG